MRSFAAIIVRGLALCCLAASGPADAAGPAGGIDVLGMKVGISSLADARAALAKMAFTVHEQDAQLIGRSEKRGPYAPPIDIPNGHYVVLFDATSQAFADRSWGCSSGSTGTENCEHLTIRFTSAPNPPTVMSVQRDITFATRPLLDTVAQSLEAKYGAPGYHASYGGHGVQWDYVWAWNAAGQSIPLSIQHPCVPQNMAILRDRDDGAKAAVQAGCAVLVHVVMQTDNGTVTYMSIMAVDHLRSYAAMQKTQAFVAAGVSQSDQSERDKAATAAVPKL